MDLEVFGRHALLFDDDAMSAFVNSGDALVEWNSLQIDRYDVRHLLSSPPPPRRRRNPLPHSSDSSFESELDHERYLDLPPPIELEVEEKDESVDASGYHHVGFSYGDDIVLAEKNNIEDGNECPGFRPPFPVPEYLLESLPSSEKIHQIISRTALFVSKHGGQSEIVLRVKQGDNPTFGFLMPDHQLHAYFRFLVDRPEHLHSNPDANLQDGNRGNDGNKKSDDVGGALSMLGSVYGCGEDEDPTVDEQDSNITLGGSRVNSVDSLVSQAVDKPDLSPSALENDEAAKKHSLPSQKGKPSMIKKNPSVNTFRAESSTSAKNVDRSSSCPPATEKLENYSVEPISKAESLIVEPPSDMKKTVDKIVDFIVKNGKQFETTLIEQDRKHGRFPFLLQSNLYYPYYCAVLQKAQETKRSGKSSIYGKDDESVVARERKAFPVMPNSSASITSCGSDMPFESDRKEKFKMVIGKSKKDEQDPPSKVSSQESGVCIGAEAAAAILQAAARGIKNPEIGIVSSASLNCKTSDPSSSRHNSISGNTNLSKSKDSIHTVEDSDFSGAQLTKEQKLRAERLRRAKMFVSMLKGGAPGTSVPVRGSSLEPQAFPVSGTGTEDHLTSKEREGNSPSVSEENKILDKKVYNEEQNERRSKRKYRSRPGSHDEEDYDEDANRNSSMDDGEVKDKKERGHKHSKRKKHHSHRSTRSGKDYESDEEGMRHKHSKRKHRAHRSSEEDHDGNVDDSDSYRKSSRRKHSSRRSSEAEDDDSNDKDRHHHRKKRHSSRHGRHDRGHSKKRSIREKESFPEHKHDSLSENESHGKTVRETNLADLEEGEIASKLSDQSREAGDDRVSREASLGVSSSHHSATPQLSDPLEVSDDLRAKIRAMLMATR